MLLLLFLLWFAYALLMTGIVVSTWTVRVALWLLVWTWRLGRWGWQRQKQRRRRDPRRP